MIVVFGSINIDVVIAASRLPRPGETVLGGALRLLPGGKGANQALAAARAGARVTLVGAVGRDAFAEPALALLREGGVDLSHVDVRADAPTGCAAITVASSAENLITVAPGANGLVDDAMLPDALLGPAATLLMQLEIPTDAVARAARRARDRGARVILNAAPAAALEAPLLATLDLVIANEGEAAALGEAPARVARRLRVGLIETRGAAGAVAHLADGTRIAVPAFAVAPVDTTGAGDAFAGMLAAALDLGLPLAEALRRASAAGGLACTRPGAQSALPDAASIDALLQREAARR